MMEAGELLGMSERQFRRYRDRYEEDGLEGLLDRRLGRPSPKRVPAAGAARMLELYREAYRGWNVKHFHEHLVRDHGFRWGYTWVKTQLHTAGLVERAQAARRASAQARAQAVRGHDAAPGRLAGGLAGGQPMLDLIVTMDDATSTLYSAFLVEEEGTASTFQALLEVFTAKGLPSSLYTDRGSHYFYTPTADGAVDKERLTQVGRALERLGIEHIPAYSPEARGRSERMFGTLQDRLIKELAKAGITEIAAANALDPRGLPAGPQCALRQAGGAARERLRGGRSGAFAETLCVQEERVVVARDNTVAYTGCRLQLPAKPAARSLRQGARQGARISRRHLAVFHGPRRIARYTSEGAPIEAEPSKLAA